MNQILPRSTAPHAVLSAAEQLLGEVFAAIDTGIVVLDVAGCITLINPAFLRLSRRRPADVIGYKFTDFLPPEDRVAAEETHREVLSTGKRVRRETKWRSADEVIGVSVTSSIRISPPDGSVYRVITMLEYKPLLAAQVPLDRLLVPRAGKATIIGTLHLGTAVAPGTDGAQCATAGEVRKITADLLQHGLAADDMFTETEDGFLVSFHDEDAATVDRRGLALVKDLQLALSGVLGRAALAQIRLDIANVAVPENPHEVNMIERITARLQASRASLANDARAAVQEAIAEDLVERIPVYASGRRLSPLQLIQLPDHLADRVERAQRYAQDAESLEFDIDLYLLGKAAELIMHGGLSRSDAVYVVPVHYASLSTRKMLDAYLQVCRATGDPVRRHLILELRCVPSDSRLRLGELISYLSPFATGIGLELERLDGPQIELARQPLLMISFKAAALEQASQSIEKTLHKLREAAQARRARLLAKDVMNLEMATLLSVHGVDLMSGPGARQDLPADPPLREVRTV